MERKYYAVAVGRKRGVVQTWDECKQRVHGFAKAVFKSFRSPSEAQAFLAANPAPNSQAPPAPVVPQRRKHSNEGDSEPELHKKPDLHMKPEIVVRSHSVLPMGPVTFLYADGACQEKRCGAGFLLKDAANRILHQEARYLPSDTTNNEAEYDALILGLQECISKGLKSVEIRVDSMLVVQQSEGNWRINEKSLMQRWEQTQALLAQLDYFRFQHIYREFNREADALSKLALTM